MVAVLLPILLATVPVTLGHGSHHWRHSHHGRHHHHRHHHHHEDEDNGPFDLMAALNDIAAFESDKYNCTIAVSFRKTGMDRTSSVIAGLSDFDTGRKSQLSDKFVWGSVTKVVTGSSILRLVDQGVFGLDDGIIDLVDPILEKMADAEKKKKYGRSLEELFGPEVKKVTIRDLLGMKSGIPDFDTAKPEGKYPTDSFRATVYANPEHVFGPMELLNLDWVRTGELAFEPGSRFGYSSTNYMLLGFILAAQNGYSSWKNFPQSDAFPKELKEEFQNISFATSGAPDNLTLIHGYDRTSYNNQTGSKDVWTTSGVFAGWTASDIVATVGDVANMTFEVYGPDQKIISKKIQEEMIPDQGFYGLATMDFDGFTGNESLPEHHAYGHLGATYGYQSIVSYHPYLDIAIAIASSIETDRQNQPADTLCLTYNTMLNHQLGKPKPSCKYEKSSYYRATCTCTTPSIED